MKTRFVAALLALLLMLSLAACGETEVASVLEQAAEAGISLGEPGEEDDTPGEVPQCVQDLSEEENALLNGEWKDGVYLNEYFGYRFTLPEGGTMTRLHDEATEWTEPVSLAACYEGKEGGLIFMADIPDLDGFVMIGIQARKDDEFGLDEEALVEKNIRDIWQMNQLFGEDRGPELGTAVFAGEEHPAAIQTSEISSGTQNMIDLYIPKGDFLYLVTVTVNNGDWEPLLALFEKA